MMAPMTVHDGSAALLDHVEPATVMAGAPFQAFKPRQDANFVPLMLEKLEAKVMMRPESHFFL
jgi:hypothetical protein